MILVWSLVGIFMADSVFCPVKASKIPNISHEILDIVTFTAFTLAANFMLNFFKSKAANKKTFRQKNLSYSQVCIQLIA